MMIFTVMAPRLDFVVGYAGLLDLGYVAFYAMGAYMAGWFASSQFSNENLDFGASRSLPGRHRVPLFDLARAAHGRDRYEPSLGVIIGLPTLRLRGDHLAIVMLGFGVILAQVARIGNDLVGGFNLTNGTRGINTNRSNLSRFR